MNLNFTLKRGASLGRPVFALCFLLFLAPSKELDHERGLRALRENIAALRSAAEAFHVSPRLVASIVYAERASNIKPGEDVVDRILAETGYNSSLGLAQVKVETAEWISLQLHDATSRFYPGPDCEHLLPEPPTRHALLVELSHPDTNLLYAAAYVAIIQKTWQSVFAIQVVKERMPGITATLYSLGLRRSDGSIREAHVDAGVNSFGEVAQNFYDSFEMVAELPR